MSEGAGPRDGELPMAMPQVRRLFGPAKQPLGGALEVVTQELSFGAGCGGAAGGKPVPRIPLYERRRSGTCSAFN